MFVPSFVVAVVILSTICDNVYGEAVEPPISEPIVTAVDYNHNADALQGFLATPTSSDGPFSAVIIIPYVIIYPI